MKKTRKIQRLLERMAAIERMERGKICAMAGRSYYNHQTWHDGKNVVRYVRPEEVAELQEAIDGYNRFRQLVEEYADEITRLTRLERAKLKKKQNQGAEQKK
jgi:hypothetical protein